jgi:hypothetical protein
MYAFIAKFTPVIRYGTRHRIIVILHLTIIIIIIVIATIIISLVR